MGVVGSDGERQLLRFDAIGELFQFEYSFRLQFLHESDFRNAPFFAVQVDSTDIETFVTCTSEMEQDLVRGRICDKVELRHIGVVEGVDIGFGMFAIDIIDVGTLIGEYVGIMGSCTTPSQYSLNYPSCSGEFEINASYTGNMVRFVNHSNNPNCQFRVVVLEMTPHVVCIAKRGIQKDEQITVNYGAAFWSYHSLKEKNDLKEVPL